MLRHPQGDVNGLAHELVERFGSLAGALDASAEELKKTPGVGEHTAVLLRMLPALLGRYQGSRARLAAVINWPEDAYAWLEPYFFGARNEMVYVLCLDGKRQVLGVRRVAEGSIEMAQVNTRRIAEEALGLRAARIYVAHNHVSNLALPSQADWLVTDVLRAGAGPHWHPSGGPPDFCGRGYALPQGQRAPPESVGSLVHRPAPVRTGTLLLPAEEEHSFFPGNPRGNFLEISLQ